MENVASIVSVVVAFAILAVIAFIRVRGNVKEWLLWAVAETQNYLGTGTGELKLRRVYDKAVERFPIIKYIIPFSIFSDWVGESLDALEEQIKNNDKIANFCNGNLIDCADEVTIQGFSDKKSEENE